MAAPREAATLPVNGLVYYQKPAVGADAAIERARAPIHVIYASGGFGIGLPPRDPEAARPNEREDEDNGVLASAPLTTTLDRQQIREYKLAFIVLAILNVVLTFSLFFNADRVDTSRVEKGTGYLSSAFTEIPHERRSIEEVNFAFLIILQVVGAVAAWRGHATGLSAFALGILMNFVLSNAALPYFVFSLRFVVDFVQLYVALVLRSRLMVTFLALNPHRF